MQDNRENSVIRALRDLSSLEEERVKKEKQERAAADQALKAEQERIERERAQAEAEQERRLKLEAELKQKDEDARRRVLSLKAELAAVQTEREAMRQAMMTRYESAAPRSASGVSLQHGVIGLLALLVLGMGALLIFSNGQSPPVKEDVGFETAAEWRQKLEAITAELSASAESGVESSADGPAVDKADPKPGLVENGRTAKRRPAKAKPGGFRGRGSRGKPGRGNKTETKTSIIDTFSKCGNDPMCGAVELP